MPPRLAERFMHGICRSSLLSFPLVLRGHCAPVFGQTPEVVITNPQGAARNRTADAAVPYGAARSCRRPASTTRRDWSRWCAPAISICRWNDVIALALENNVDIAVQRYGPYLAREVLAPHRRRWTAAQRRPGHRARPHQREPGRCQCRRGGTLGSRLGRQFGRRHRDSARHFAGEPRSLLLRRRELQSRQPHRRATRSSTRCRSC